MQTVDVWKFSTSVICANCVLASAQNIVVLKIEPDFGNEKPLMHNRGLEKGFVGVATKNTL